MTGVVVGAGVKEGPRLEQWSTFAVIAGGAAAGFELLALAVLIGGGMLILDRRARVGPTTPDPTAPDVASILDAVAPNALTSILLLIAGLLLVFGLHAGLDVLVLPVIVALAGGVTSAWLLLTKMPA